MTTFIISTDAYDVSYEAESEMEAILAMVQDAGYATISDAADLLGETEQAFIDRQIVTRA